MNELEGLLAAVVEDPLAEDLWSIIADWLEDFDDPRRAELARLHRRLFATCCDPESHPERSAWQARVVEILAGGVQPCVPQRAVELKPGVAMTFNFIPPGCFLMGSPARKRGREDEETQHRVTLTKGYWLGIHQVTQSQWQAAMCGNTPPPTYFIGQTPTQSRWHAVMGGNPSRFKGDTHPLESVSWDMCQEFIEKVGKKTGNRFRLPTEAEWEHACRAGTTTPFHFGETISTDQANYNGNHAYGQGKIGLFRRKTTPVGSLPANAWGLYDMHGNVWEWCADWYDKNYYADSPPEDPRGPKERGYVATRGGSWFCNGSGCRSAYRTRRSASPATTIGFRVALIPSSE